MIYKRDLKDAVTSPPTTTLPSMVSPMCVVITSHKRVLTGYYDSSRGVWFINGGLSGEVAVEWTSLDVVD